MSARRRILVVALALVSTMGAIASAQEGEAQPPVVVAPAKPRSNAQLMLQVGGTGGYLRTLGQSFGGGGVDVRIGGGNRVFTIALRVNGLFGQSAGGLGFERVLAGASVKFQIFERVRFGISVMPGIFVYQRALATADPHVYAAAMGLLVDVDIDLVRGKAGALVLAPSIGYEFIDTIPQRAGDTFSGQLALAWRY